VCHTRLKLSWKVTECKPLPGVRCARYARQSPGVEQKGASTSGQGLTLVDFSDQLERFVWRAGVVQRVLGGC
jgi:hypothetical protein